jgi:Domain of unknown function (DUF4145)
LQNVLREYAKTKGKDLVDQIQEVIDQGHLPPTLAEQLDAVRIIGKFAAHPLKSQNAGTILPVEDHEAGWNLNFLESVFDHYFVMPAIGRERKAALNKKLAEAGNHSSVSKSVNVHSSQGRTALLKGTASAVPQESLLESGFSR